METAYGKIIRDFFSQEKVVSKSDGIYIITPGINHNDASFSPISKFIEEKKPKILYYYYPTEHSFYWFNNEILNGGEEKRIEIESVLLKNNTKLKFIIGGDDIPAYRKINNNPPHIKNFEILYWPTYLLYMTYEMLHNNLNFNGDNIKDFKTHTAFPNFQKLYLNYNSKPRNHRCVMMDYLFKNNLFEYGFNSWNEKQSEHGLMYSNHDPVLYDEKQYKFKFWKEELLSIDNYNSSDKNFVGEHSNELYNPPAFMVLVGETGHGFSPITEKTFRYILIQQPFLSYGGVNQNKELLKYGFKLYDEIFDYDFESNPNLESRIQGVIDNLNKIKDMNYQEIYNKIKPKLEFNQKRAEEIIKNDIYCPQELVDVYKKYFNNF